MLIVPRCQVSNTTTNEVAIVISIAQCSGTVCPDASQTLGTALYTGSYHPVVKVTGIGPINPTPHQAFNVTVPSTLHRGNYAQLTVTHFATVGVRSRHFLTIGVIADLEESFYQTGPAPYSEVKGVDLIVA